MSKHTLAAKELKELCIAKDKRIAELEGAIKDTLYGSPLDKQGAHREDDGLCAPYKSDEYSVDRAKKILSEALKKEPDT